MTNTTKTYWTAIVHSSFGDITINNQGLPVCIHPTPGVEARPDPLDQIVRFNLAEYEAHYGDLPTEFDILDLGYWFDDPATRHDRLCHDYCRPEANFREVAANRG